MKKILLILLGLSLNFLCSCATSPPDVLLCTEISFSRGWCTKTISDVEFEINEEKPYTFTPGKPPMTWWSLRPSFIYVPAESWAEIKAWIIKTCKQTNQCDNSIASWQRKIDAVDKKIKEKSQ